MSTIISKSDVLRSLVGVFASGVAEQEYGLANYFVETESWRQLYEGHKNVVLGAKGSGKSALFTLLLSSPHLLPQGTVIIGAERPIHETSLFKEFFRMLADNPPPDSIALLEFEYLWRAYFLVLIAEALQQCSVQNQDTQALLNGLRQLQILPPKGPHPLLQALKYVASVVLGARLDISKHDMGHDVSWSLVSISWQERIVRQRTDSRQREASLDTLSRLFKVANDALKNAQPKLTIWLALDRLDDVFPNPQSRAYERDTLAALLAVYKDVMQYGHIRLKLFLRSDVFRRVTVGGGFVNLDKIEPRVELMWEADALKTLVLYRCVQSDLIRAKYGLHSTAAEAIAALRDNRTKQDELFNQIFPAKLRDPHPVANDNNNTNPNIMRWVRLHLMDGEKHTAPRYVIKLIDLAITRQLQAGERTEDEHLFTTETLRWAMRQVSTIYYEGVFGAEYPMYVHLTDSLNQGGKQDGKQENYRFLLSALQRRWSLDEVEAEIKARELKQLGFFMKQNEVTKRGKLAVYEVAPVYRYHLELTGDQITS